MTRAVPQRSALFVIAAVCLCSLAANALAQNAADPATLPDDDSRIASPSDYEPSPIRFEGELVAALALPFDGGTPAFGFALTYGVGWGAFPLMLGLDFVSLNRLGSDRSQTTLTMGDQMQTATNASKDRTLYFDVWLRVQPPRWPVRPYLEGVLGTKVLQTQYSRTLGDPATASSINGGDHAWANSYGWGVGVDFLDLIKADASMSLTLGMRRLTGAKAVIERAAFVDNNDVVINRAVHTSVTIFMLGISGRVDLSAPKD